MPKVISEIGCNHKGSIQIALEMIKASAQCGANIAKFQKRNVIESLRPEIYNGPHPNPVNSYGTTYGQHREFLEFEIDTHYLLKDECVKHQIEYSCTPFDLTSAKQIEKLNPHHVKISSFHNNYPELINYICENYSCDIHISLRMTTKAEMQQLVDIIKSCSREKDTVLYWCTSAYPCSPENLHLLEIKSLLERFSESFKAIGFSGHHDGIAMDIVAFNTGCHLF